jgi:hypothetical protein
MQVIISLVLNLSAEAALTTSKQPQNGLKGPKMVILCPCSPEKLLFRCWFLDLLRPFSRLFLRPKFRYKSRKSRIMQVIISY